MAAEDDKWLYLIIGGLGGVFVGMMLFKYLFSQQSATAQQPQIYGSSYTYDEAGHLIGYMPLPLSTQTQTQT